MKLELFHESTYKTYHSQEFQLLSIFVKQIQSNCIKKLYLEVSHYTKNNLISILSKNTLLSNKLLCVISKTIVCIKK